MVAVTALLLLVGTAVHTAVGAGDDRAARRATLGGMHTHVIEQPIRQGTLSVLRVPAGTGIPIAGDAGNGNGASELAAGEMLVSPALARELRGDPFLRARLPWSRAGTLGRDMLTRPGEHLAVIGHSDADGAHDHIAGHTHSSSTTKGLVALTVLAILLQCVVLIGMAHQLHARRWYALAGATVPAPTGRQLRTVAVIEGLVAGSVGGALGAIVALPARSLVAGTFGLYAEDLRLSLGTIVALVAATAAISVAAAWHACRQIEVDAPAVPERGASPARLLLLLTGVGMGVYAIGFAPHPGPSGGLFTRYEMAAIALVFAGVVASAPVLIRLTAQLGRRMGTSAAQRTAFRSLEQRSQAACRGMALLAVVTFPVVYYGALEPEPPTPQWPAADVAVELAGVPPGPILDALASEPGVRAVAPVAYEASSRRPGSLTLVTTCEGLPALGVTGHRGTCRPGSLVDTDQVPGEITEVRTLPASDFADRPLSSVQVLTDGRTRSIEAATAVAARAKPLAVLGPDRLNQPSEPTAGLTRSLRAVLVVAALLAFAGMLLATVDELEMRRRAPADPGDPGVSRHRPGSVIAAHVCVPLAVAVVPSMLAAVPIVITEKLVVGAATELRPAGPDVALPLVLALAVAAVATLVLRRARLTVLTTRPAPSG